MKEKLRKSGIDVTRDLPWGTHFCHFYQTKKDLVEIVVPYFKAGLENNEFCLWITSPPLEVEEAVEALREAVPDADIYLEKRQIEIISYTCLHLTGSIYDSERVINGWIEKLNHALESGYEGLRLGGNVFWLIKNRWEYFVDHIRKMDDIIGKYRMITLGSYFVEKYSATEIIEIVSNHQFSLSKKKGKWKRIDNIGRKKAEEAAIRAVKDWEYTFDAIPDPIAIIDTRYRIVRANKAMAARLGVTPEECVGLTCCCVIHGTKKPPSFCPHRQSLKDGLEHTAEVCEDRLGGYFIVSTSPLYDSEGKLTGSIHVARDINERKQEERQIHRYNRILEEINQIFSNVVRAKTEKELGNACLSVALKMTSSQIGFVGEVGDDGIMHDIAISDSGWDKCLMYDKTGHLCRPGDFVVHGLYGRIINSGKSFFTNKPQSHPDSIGLPHGHPSLTSFLGVPLIQDRKTMGVLVVANRKGGYTCEQQEDLEAIAPAVIQVLQRKKGEQERKQAEEALKKAHDNLEVKVKERTIQLEKAYRSSLENERRLNEAQKIAHIGGWDWDLVTDEMYWSDEIYRIFGLNPQEFNATYDAFLSYVHPDDRNYVDETVKKASKEEQLYGIDYRIISAVEEERIVHAHIEAIFDEKNDSARMGGTLQDVTELKKAEEKIQILVNAVESSNDAVGTMSLDGIITSWNKGAEQVYGYSAEEILGKSVLTLAPSHLDKETINLIEKIKQGEEIRQYETLRLRKDGETINISLTLSPVFDIHGKLTAVSFISRDITERKRSEEKLRESEEKYRNIVEIANEGILIIDDKATITYANKKITDMFGYSLEEGLGRPIWDFISEESKAIAKLNLKKRRQGVNGSYELKLINKDGLPLWTFINAKSLFDKGGKFIGSLSMLTDVTNRKEAEEVLANVETARKKEIHHRIKNNLQVISSLLDLQAEKFKDRECIKDCNSECIKNLEVLEAFRESQNRVISMALIHEELYKGGGFEALNFSPYIEELAENLFQTYRVGNTDISLKLDLAENVLFDMDTAVPLGIIVNELVSNSLKHAFTGRDKGEVRIKLRREENKKGMENREYINSREESKNESCKSTNYTLTVSDNGVGIPEKLDIEDLDTLGFQLVTSLADQLDGEFKLKRNNGTEFTLRFTVTEKMNEHQYQHHKN
jgi:PAS domain S-box-containing protein